MIESKRISNSTAQRNIPQSIIEKNIIFIHVPRTAGSSMIKAGFEEVYGHVDIKWYIERNPGFVENAFSFAFVRNPWDRVHSAYKYLSSANLNAIDSRFNNNVLRKYDSFNDFILHGLQTEEVLTFMHFVPQIDFLKDRNGHVNINFVGKFENVDLDFKTVCSVLNKTFKLQKINASKPENYRDVYSEQTRKKVAEVYADDIKTFNYEF